MRGFGSTEIESGMTCLQLGHVADSPTRSPSVDNRCAAASQSERHRAWRVVPQHAITFVFSNAKSSRQQTHTSSGATVNTLAGDGRVNPPSSASSSSSDPSISQVVGVASSTRYSTLPGVAERAGDELSAGTIGAGSGALGGL